MVNVFVLERTPASRSNSMIIARKRRFASLASSTGIWRVIKKKRAVVFFGWEFFLISLGSPHAGAQMGHTCGEPNKSTLTAAHRSFYRPLVRYPRSKEGTANESEAMKNITLQDLVKIGTGQQMRLLIRHSEEKETDDDSESDDEKLSTGTSRGTQITSNVHIEPISLRTSS